MNRFTVMTRPGNEGRTFRTLIVSVVGLLPVGLVSGMMLMQILGIWNY